MATLSRHSDGSQSKESGAAPCEPSGARAGEFNVHIKHVEPLEFGHKYHRKLMLKAPKPD